MQTPIFFNLFRLLYMNTFPKTWNHLFKLLELKSKQPPHYTQTTFSSHTDVDLDIQRLKYFAWATGLKKLNKKLEYLDTQKSSHIWD